MEQTAALYAELHSNIQLILTVKVVILKAMNL